MSTDSSGSQFTLTEIRIDDPRMNEYDELPEEEKQSSFVATIQLLDKPFDYQHKVADPYGSRHCTFVNSWLNPDGRALMLVAPNRHQFSF